MKLFGVYVPVELVCAIKTSKCAHRVVAKAPIYECDSRGITLGMASAADLRDLVPYGWYFRMSVGTDPSVSFVCDECRKVKGWQPYAWSPRELD